MEHGIKFRMYVFFVMANVCDSWISSIIFTASEPMVDPTHDPSSPMKYGADQNISEYLGPIWFIQPAQLSPRDPTDH